MIVETKNAVKERKLFIETQWPGASLRRQERMAANSCHGRILPCVAAK